MKSVFRPKSVGPLQLNMTSMIDVIFLLLVFFVLTANFDKLEKLLPTNLFLSGTAQVEPKTVQEEPPMGEIVVKITHSGKKISWLVNNRTCSSLSELDGVLEQLAAISKSVPVIIDPDRGLAIENVLDVYDSCRRTGLTHIQFAAEEESAGGNRP